MSSFKIQPVVYRPPPTDVRPPAQINSQQSYSNGASTFNPYSAPPVALPQPPATPPANPVDALRGVFNRYKDQLPGLKAGVSETDRKAAIDVLRDASIEELKKMGFTATKHLKANGQFSNDAFDVVGPDGSRQVIDFMRASKDTDRDVTVDNVQWLDVTNGGGAGMMDMNAFDPNNKDDPFLKLLRAIGTKPGARKGASQGERKQAVTQFRDEFIKAGEAQGLNFGLNMDPNTGEAAADSVVYRAPDGKQTVINLAKDAFDTSKEFTPDLEQLKQLGSFGYAGHFEK